MKLKSVQTIFVAAVGCVLVTAAPAFAGKPERDKADELKPVAEKAQSTVKTACGCDVKVGVKFDSFAKADDMQYIDRVLDSLETAVKHQCEKEADKKALCDSLTEVEVAYQQDESSVKLEGKKIVATTGPHSYSSDTMFTQILNQF